MIGVVSAKFDPAYIEAQVASFLKAWLQKLARMPPDEFKRNVEAAVANRLRDDHNLGEEAQRLFAEVENRQYRFDRADREAVAMRATSTRELHSWAHTALLPGRRLRHGPEAEPGGRRHTRGGAHVGHLAAGHLDVRDKKNIL